GGGLYKTTDGGATWTRLLAKSSSFFTEAYALDINPLDGNNVAWCHRNNGELYVTTDGGSNWTTVSTVGNVRCVSFLTSPADVVIALGGGFQGRDIYKSTDKGLTWALLDTITWDPVLLTSNNES